jgi:hypothetical protein
MPPPPSGDTNNCLTQLMNEASYNALNAYNNYIDSIAAAFTAGYIAHCVNSVEDSFHMNGPFDEYHYTLYYYDQAENLVKTILRQGVHTITSAASLDSINKYRSGVSGYHPVYPNGDSLMSLYWFNSEHFRSIIRLAKCFGGRIGAFCNKRVSRLPIRVRISSR